MQELVHPAEGRELAERELRHDYHQVCDQALPPVFELERELRAMRAEIRAEEDHQRLRPLTETWLRRRAEEQRKERPLRP